MEITTPEITETEITTPEVTETEITTPEVTEITINLEYVPAVIITGGGNEDHRNRKQLRKQHGIGPEIPEVLMFHGRITEVIMDYIGIIKIIIKIMVPAIQTEIAQDHKNVVAIAMDLQFVNIPIIMAVAK